MIFMPEEKTCVDCIHFAHCSMNEEPCESCLESPHMLPEYVLKDPITPNTYQNEALRTAPFERFTHDEMIINGALGLAGESGEFADIIKKALFQGHELDKVHCAKELGDICWYVAITANALGFSMNDIFCMNIQKLRDRYPDGFSVQNSVNRKEGDV